MLSYIYVCIYVCIGYEDEGSMADFEVVVGSFCVVQFISPPDEAEAFAVDVSLCVCVCVCACVCACVRACVRAHVRIYCTYM